MTVINSNLIQQIRKGESVTVHVPRSKWKKFFAWCLKENAKNNLEGVLVRVLWSGNYDVKEDKRAKRIGRAIPRVIIPARWDVQHDRYEIGYPLISWSYVF